MKFFICILFLIIPTTVLSEIIIDTNYREVKHFNQSDWNRITKNHQYPKGESKALRSNKIYQSPAWIKYVSYIVVISLLIFLIYRLLIYLSIPSTKKVQTGEINIIENEITYDHEYLDQKLTEAIKESNLRLAVRFSYLIAIRDLSEARLIVASKDKTNYEYLLELDKHPLKIPFKNIINTFEKTWYGELIPLSSEYSKFENQFRELLSQINPGRKDSTS
jgi:hypothetical protein